MNGFPGWPETFDGMTFGDVADLPVVVDLLTAARVLGIGRTTAYALARAGDFPCSILKVGGGYRVPTIGLLRLLGVEVLARLGRTSGATGSLDRGESTLGLPRALPSARA